MAKKAVKKTTKKTAKKKAGTEVVKRKVGRPKVNPDDYNECWRHDMIEGYANGKSDVWCRVNCFGDHVVRDDLWYRWIDEIEEFSRTLKHGHRVSLIWWEDLSQNHAAGINTDANATMIIFNKCNRFRDHYQQKQIVEQTTKHALDINELDKLREYLKEFGVNLEDL